MPGQLDSASSSLPAASMSSAIERDAQCMCQLGSKELLGVKERSMRCTKMLHKAVISLELMVVAPRLIGLDQSTTRTKVWIVPPDISLHV
jgi:hypothetical protein